MKVIEGLGTTIDVVLVNGVLHEGDQIVVCGLQASTEASHLAGDFVRLLDIKFLNIVFLFQGPIVTTIRALLTPHPMKELRVKVYLVVNSLYTFKFYGWKCWFICL